MSTNKLSTLWTNFTTDIVGISQPLVAWETVAKEVIQLTDKITVGGVITPATYRVYVFPVDLNDFGASDRDVEVGYNLMDFFGQVFSIIAVNVDDSIDVSDDLLGDYCPVSGLPTMIYSLTSPVPIVPVQPPVPPYVVPVDPYRAGQYTGMIFSAIGVTDFLFSFGSETTLATIPLVGRNYLFLSLPANKTFKVVDGSGVNITAKFTDTLITDNIAGYQDNKVYKKVPPYASEDAIPFYVTIYS